MLQQADFIATADFIAASLRHVEALRLCQRHDAAECSLYALRRLAGTIRRQATEHGYMPDMLLGAELAAVDAATADLAH